MKWNDKKSTYFIDGRKPCKVGDDIPDSVLLKMGKERVKMWKEDGTILDEDKRDELYEKAKSLGLKPHYKTGVNKLKEMIHVEAKKAENESDNS